MGVFMQKDKSKHLSPFINVKSTRKTEIRRIKEPEHSTREFMLL